MHHQQVATLNEHSVHRLLLLVCHPHLPLFFRLTVPSIFLISFGFCTSFVLIIISRIAGFFLKSARAGKCGSIQLNKNTVISSPIPSNQTGMPPSSSFSFSYVPPLSSLSLSLSLCLYLFLYLCKSSDAQHHSIC